MKTVLELDHNEARQFFLKQESYINFSLPPYFMFEKLLNALSIKIENNALSSFYDNNGIRPEKLYDVNYTLINNKDGKYAWRPLQLTHPALYVSLVHKMTEQEYWEFIVSKFNDYGKHTQIQCFSIPIETEEDDGISGKAAMVEQWVEKIEKESISLSMKYEYMIITDISNCYESIYTHSIAWSLHTKEDAKKDKGKKKVLIGNIIDSHLRDMSYGQTNGIPQGSVLMDFIAEIVLGYAAHLLKEKIKKQGVDDYQILRYRDDYRIFANNQRDAEMILKLLSEVLMDLGLKLNSQKTLLSNNIIRDSIKPDKYFWITHENSTEDLQKYLLLIFDLSIKFPNSGSLDKELNHFYHKIEKLEYIDNVNILVSILVEIAYKNPRVYPTVAAILSKIMSMEEDKNRKTDIVNLILTKFSQIPNTGYMQIWLQRITLCFDKDKEYEEKLCKKVVDSSIEIWNSDWLNASLKNIVETTSIVDEEIINNIREVIEGTEFQLFPY
jgi:hypothetical protein